MKATSIPAAISCMRAWSEVSSIAWSTSPMGPSREAGSLPKRNNIIEKFSSRFHAASKLFTARRGNWLWSWFALLHTSPTHPENWHLPLLQTWNWVAHETLSNWWWTRHRAPWIGALYKLRHSRRQGVSCRTTDSRDSCCLTSHPSVDNHVFILSFICSLPSHETTRSTSFILCEVLSRVVSR